MMIPGEIRKTGSYYGALIEAIGAYAQGKTRESACASLEATVLEIAADHRPIGDFKVTVTDDGDATLYLNSNDSSRLIATLLRCQRESHDMSLADVAESTGAKSRNGYAQYEQGRADPSIAKLQELLDAVAPELVIAIVPRTARVVPRWDEEADDAAEIDAIIKDPSEANIRAFVAKRPAPPRPFEKPVVPRDPPTHKALPRPPSSTTTNIKRARRSVNIDSSQSTIVRGKATKIAR